MQKIKKRTLIFIIFIIFTIFTVFTFSACGDSTDSPEQPQTEIPQKEEAPSGIYLNKDSLNYFEFKNNTFTFSQYHTYKTADGYFGKWEKEVIYSGSLYYYDKQFSLYGGNAGWALNEYTIKNDTINPNNISIKGRYTKYNYPFKDKTYTKISTDEFETFINEQYENYLYNQANDPIKGKTFVRLTEKSGATNEAGCTILVFGENSYTRYDYCIGFWTTYDNNPLCRNTINTYNNGYITYNQSDNTIEIPVMLKNQTYTEINMTAKEYVDYLITTGEIHNYPLK